MILSRGKKCNQAVWCIYTLHPEGLKCQVLSVNWFKNELTRMRQLVSSGTAEEAEMDGKRGAGRKEGRERAGMQQQQQQQQQ